MRNRENAEIKRMEGELASACSILAMLRKRERRANLNCKTPELRTAEMLKLQNREIAEIKRMEGELASACSILAMLR
ncbi:MAG: hypothetical protein IPN72_04730 [Saprospiraceae bacterium]|nr:hypothetical protein [Saprospiraceae bacterium]